MAGSLEADVVGGTRQGKFGYGRVRADVTGAYIDNRHANTVAVSV